jgi:hypothetical protein
MASRTVPGYSGQKVQLLTLSSVPYPKHSVPRSPANLRIAVRFDFRVNNLLNAQGPIFTGSTALRPKGGDLTSPARETVPNVYAYKTPASVNFTTTLRF